MKLRLIGVLAVLAGLGACAGMPESGMHTATTAGPAPAASTIAEAPTVIPTIAAATKAEATSTTAAPQPLATVASRPPAPAPTEPSANAGPFHGTPAGSTAPAPVLARKPRAAATRHKQPEPAATSSVMLRGQVLLTAGSGQRVSSGDVADTIVYFVPAAPFARPAPGTFTVYTQNRAFNPAALAIPLDSTVHFVNLDDVRHNVFSVTPGSAFNLGYQGSGQSAAHRFGNPGLILISCNVHRTMELDLLVVPSPYATKVSADGAFALRGLPGGPGTLYFWNPRARLAAQKIVVPADNVQQRLVAIKPRMNTELDTEPGK